MTDPYVAAVRRYQETLELERRLRNAWIDALIALTEARKEMEDAHANRS